MSSHVERVLVTLSLILVLEAIATICAVVLLFSGVGPGKGSVDNIK